MRQLPIRPPKSQHVKSDPVKVAHGLFGMDVEVDMGDAGPEELWGSDGSPSEPEDETTEAHPTQAKPSPSRPSRE